MKLNTKQEIFDFVLAKMRKQRCRSCNPGNTSECAYRGEGNLKCAI